MDQTGFHLCAAKWSSAASSFCCEPPIVEMHPDVLMTFGSSGSKKNTKRRLLRMRCTWL